MWPMGDAALLVEVADLDAVLALAAAVRAAEWPHVLDVVPGACTVVVAVEPGTDLAALRRAVLDAAGGRRGPAGGPGRRDPGASTRAPTSPRSPS